MPSQLINNEAISFIVVKPLKWYDHEYEIGDDFPQEDANNIETLIRSRWLVPVVDSIEDKPRHWHRHVRLREEVLAEIEQPRTQIVMPDQGPAHEDSTDTLAGSDGPPDESASQADDTTPGAGEEPGNPGFDPETHTVASVLTYMEEHPEDAQRVRDLEAHGKNRKGIVEGY